MLTCWVCVLATSQHERPHTLFHRRSELWAVRSGTQLSYLASIPSAQLVELNEVITEILPGEPLQGMQQQGAPTPTRTRSMGLPV